MIWSDRLGVVDDAGADDAGDVGDAVNPEPILVDCEGSGVVAKNVRKYRGTCTFCNERVALNPDGVGAAPHQRWDIEAMIARGDFR